jgi:uncharacterized membrane protein
VSALHVVAGNGNGDGSHDGDDPLYDSGNKPSPAHESLADVPGLHARLDTIEEQVRDLTSSVLKVQGSQAEARATSARYQSHVMSAVSAILSRLDKSETDDAARDAQAMAVHRDARAARDEAAALGAQTGVVAAEVAAAREKLDSIADVGERIKGIEDAHTGWLATGRVVEKFAKAHLWTAVTAIVTALGGFLLRHLLGAP